MGSLLPPQAEMTKEDVRTSHQGVVRGVKVCIGGLLSQCSAMSEVVDGFLLGGLLLEGGAGAWRVACSSMAQSE